MNEPVAVPVQETGEIERKVRSASSETQILDEGLDISGYRGTHDSPFVADYFGIRDLYKTNPEISGMVDSLTKDLLSKTDGQNLVYVVKSMLDEMTNEMNLKENDSGIFKLKRVLKLIEMKNQASNLETLKKKVLADIENMV